MDSYDSEYPATSPTDVSQARPITPRPQNPEYDKPVKKSARPVHLVRDTVSHDSEPRTPFIASDASYNGMWASPDSDDDERELSGKQYLDKSRSRQVYDDKKVLVLSGGVMLGRPDEPRARSRSPSGRPTHPHVPHLSINPYSTMPSGALPSLVSSTSSSFSSGDHLATPVEWSSAYSPNWTDYDDSARVGGAVPTFAPGVSLVPWAYSFPPQTTTITMNPSRPPTSRRSRRERSSQQAPVDFPLPLSPEADLAATFSALQVSAPPKSDGYVSDDAAGLGASSVSRDSSPSPAVPFRRSSVGAVVELSGKRESVSNAILREPHATHRRGRPSM